MEIDEYGTVRVKDIGTHWVDVIPLTFGRARIVITPKTSPLTYDDGWCYDEPSVAIAAALAWDGTGEPEGWMRNPRSGRRRPDGDATKEYVNL